MLATTYSSELYQLVLFIDEQQNAYQLIRDGVACNQFFNTNVKTNFLSLNPTNYIYVNENLLSEESIWGI